ncbi:unnamed protein product [Echinostoma caproni]|uniref:glutathione transferase n=1 Tax=Echinostoma caproni TaxID=27848 RepID=A0A183A9S6_9TREM|nr:unnamed protein product [Echinostoma caproni]
MRTSCCKNYKMFNLVYFNLRGRGELIRLTLHACDIPFIDERVEFPDWPKLKTTIPGGKLPSLQVTNANDGKVTHYDESMAIARWIAHKYHILGETDEEFYKIERMIGKVSYSYENLLVLSTEYQKPRILIIPKTGYNLIKKVCFFLKLPVNLSQENLTYYDIVMFFSHAKENPLVSESFLWMIGAINEFFKVFMGPPDKKEDIQQEIMKDTVPTLLSVS